MKIILKILTILLLSFNTIGALYGGTHLILHPDGSSIELSLDWLKYTPFETYLVPGIILLEVNGMFGLYVLINLLFNQKNSSKLVIAQGVLLTGWIVMQMILIRTIYFLHIILGSVGVALVILGLLLLNKQKDFARLN